MKDFQELSKFLVKAKINTYATNGESGEKILKNGCKELIYEEGLFKYSDRYFGFNPFIGEEIVWKNNKVIWGMNYYGKILSNKVSPNKIYNLLKKALRKIKIDKPFRGPNRFCNKKFKYINETEGDIKNFKGIETIFYNNKKVYLLYYHGGFVSEKKK